MNKSILIGIPGCGKSTLGRRVADVLHLPFFDTDTMTRARLKAYKPDDIFRMAYNGQIMAEQHNVMVELAELNGPAIIATGAEVALIPECATIMKTMGTVIHIRRDPEIVLADIRKSGKRDLILQGENNGTEITVQEETVMMFAQECCQYDTLADLTLENNGSEDKGLEQLINLLALMCKIDDDKGCLKS